MLQKLTIFLINDLICLWEREKNKVHNLITSAMMAAISGVKGVPSAGAAWAAVSAAAKAAAKAQPKARPPNPPPFLWRRMAAAAAAVLTVFVSKVKLTKRPKNYHNKIIFNYFLYKLFII